MSRFPGDLAKRDRISTQFPPHRRYGRLASRIFFFYPSRMYENALPPCCVLRKFVPPFMRHPLEIRVHDVKNVYKKCKYDQVANFDFCNNVFFFIAFFIVFYLFIPEK